MDVITEHYVCQASLLIRAHPTGLSPRPEGKTMGDTAEAVFSKTVLGANDPVPVGIINAGAPAGPGTLRHQTEAYVGPLYKSIPLSFPKFREYCFSIGLFQCS